MYDELISECKMYYNDKPTLYF